MGGGNSEDDAPPAGRLSRHAGAARAASGQACAQSRRTICRPPEEPAPGRDSCVPPPVRPGRRQRLMDEQHRDRTLAQHQLGVAAEGETTQAASSVRAHHDQVDLRVTRFLQDHVEHAQARVAAHRRLDGHAARARQLGGAGDEAFAGGTPVLQQILGRHVGRHLAEQQPGIDHVDQMKRRAELPRQRQGLLESTLRGGAAVDRHQDA